MLSKEALERYRAMTPSQRLELSLKMTAESLPFLHDGPPELVKRRIDRINAENAARNRALLEALSKFEPLE